MDEILLRLQSATRKTGKLETTITRLLEEREQLKATISSLTDELEDVRGKYQELTKQHDILKLVKTLDGEADRVQVVKKIDAYIKEIDACLKTFGD